MDDFNAVRAGRTDRKSKRTGFRIRKHDVLAVFLHIDLFLFFYGAVLGVLDGNRGGGVFQSQSYATVGIVSELAARNGDRGFAVFLRQ